RVAANRSREKGSLNPSSTASLISCQSLRLSVEDSRYAYIDSTTSSSSTPRVEGEVLVLAFAVFSIVALSLSNRPLQVKRGCDLPRSGRPMSLWARGKRSARSCGFQKMKKLAAGTPTRGPPSSLLPDAPLHQDADASGRRRDAGAENHGRGSAAPG